MRVLLALAFAAALAGCGTETDETAAPQTITVTQTETVIETETTAPEVECSTSGLRLTLPEQDLPEVVAEVRQRVFDAAVGCDYDTLEQIALEQGAGFSFSFGGATDPSDYWRDAEADANRQTPPMKALATILTLEVTRNEAGSYAWPSAYSESPTDEDWADLVESGLYTQADVDRIRELNQPYYGYRTAITPAGDWQFFVAGD